MDTFTERVARVILLVVGVSAALTLLAMPPADGAAAVPLLHHQFLIAVLAVAMLGAALVPALRPAVVATGLLSQAGFVGIALATPGVHASAALYLNLAGMAALLCAGVLLLQAARQQARWEGLSPRHRGA